MPAHVVDRSTTLFLSKKTKVLPGKRFSVKGPRGREVFQVEGSAMSVSGKKTVINARTGTKLYTVAEPVLTARDVRKIDDGISGDHVLTIEKKVLQFGVHTVQAWSGGHTVGNPLYKISGGLREKEFDVENLQTYKTVARVRSKALTCGHLSLKKHTSAITIDPGEDAALMVSIALCVNDFFD